MRNPFMLSSVLLFAGHALAQCPFTPTIFPSDPILCPGETAVLSTQEYESYQWYKDGEPIVGAVEQTLLVDHFNDSGSSFSVRAEEDGCLEMSANALVDGWVFLPPFVIHEGDDPISIGPFGESTYCAGAFVQLTIGMPYTESIVWTNNAVPIPGATSPNLLVTEPGNYSVSAAPAVCPNSETDLGLTIGIDFMDPVQPQILAVDDQLCALPTGDLHQWYFNGEAIINSNTPCITAAEAGSYTVYVDYDHGCQVISEPYLSTGLAVQQADRAWTLYPSPSTGLITVTWEGAMPVGTYWSIQDLAGRELRGGFMPALAPLQLDLSELPKGTYLFQAAHQRKALAPATRFTQVR